jgi:hypothetical protein
MHILSLFTISIVTVFLVVFQSLQDAEQRLEPVRVSHRR